MAAPIQPPPPSLAAKLSPWLVRLAAVWVLAVTGIKMFKGNPGSIPLVVREHSPFDEELTFFTTISIELCFSLVALVFPRWGWPLLSALMGVFIGVLLYLAAIGETSCGCFGGAVTFPPLAMLAVDGSLFALMLATQPWKQLGRRDVPWIPVTGAAALGVLAPWVLIPREVQYSAPAGRTAQAPLATQPKPPVRNPSTQPRDPRTGQPVSSVEKPKPNTADGTLTVSATSADDWKLPDKLPKWARLRPPDWVGKSIHETDLAIWMNTREYPTDATWILYLETCEHCRDYLNRLESEFGQDPKLYVFVCLATPDDEKERKIERRPPGETARLPAEVSWVIGPELPPWELVLENDVVKSAVRHGE